ncbi:uncharacterized protein DUF4240 [Yoonia maricola]|uniref:Uncharacterized protein DUF4240 n=1 Tax=Yoonia maricola TaxID=420999 RepID=A0A2M8W565_9RHOB|nr:DUF4240 domain-containing protein [Yoonia maricola]PJI86048.1 uncharacterized protein DUF4240 [Yoonia maricola]
MLSKEITELLQIEYLGLFEDNHQCMQVLALKRDSGDADTPRELTQGHIFDLSPDLFIWVTQQHINNNTAYLVAKDVMSNISTAGLSGSYGEIVDMLAAAGHEHRAAQIWRADVASHIDVFREFLRARKAVDRYNGLSEAQRKKATPDRFQKEMAEDFSSKKQIALDAVHAFERWASRYGVATLHSAQIELWKEEIQSEKKPKLPAPDKSPMSEELFWEIIARAQRESESETALKIEDHLVTYSGKAIRDAGKMLQSCLAAAHREDIWALAYLVCDGCSDDAFEDFRCWMVLRGQAMFEDIIKAPDLFDPKRADGASFAAAGSVMSAFENAYLSRTGKPLILPKGKRPLLKPDQEKFVDLLPTLSAKLGRV